MSAASISGPVLVAYDGSELAQLAIAEAGELLGGNRPALVLCVWQPFDLGFVPADDTPVNAAEITEVKAAAERTAAAGAALATAAGFTASPLAREASPAWQGIVEAGDEHGAGVIVLGSHGHSGGLTGRLIGSVAKAVVDHSKRTVLVVHRHP